MRGARVFLAVLTVTQKEALETAIDFKLHSLAQTGTRMLINHRNILPQLPYIVASTGFLDINAAPKVDL
jgi:hypothetical protein